MQNGEMPSGTRQKAQETDAAGGKASSNFMGPINQQT